MSTTSWQFEGYDQLSISQLVIIIKATQHNTNQGLHMMTSLRPPYVNYIKYTIPEFGGGSMLHVREI